MNKLQLIQEINTELNSNLKLAGNFYNNKCYVVVSNNRIDAVYKTKRGAEGYINKNKGNSYYCEYSMEMVYPAAGTIIEVLSSEVHDLKESKIIWCNELRKVLSHDYLYNNVECLANKYLSNDMLDFVITRLENMKVNNSLNTCTEYNYFKNKKEYTEAIANINECLKKDLDEYDVKYYNDNLAYYTNALSELIANTDTNIMNDINVKFFNETIEVVETKEESIIIEDAKIESNITATEDTIIEDVKIVLNQEKNGIELHFNNKPSEEIRNNMKANGFRYSKYNTCWHAKQSNDTLNFANSLSSQTPEDIKEISEEYKENKELELNNKLNELDINDIENYIVPEEISKRENDNSFFRNKPINHTQQLQNTFLNANTEVIEVLKNNTNITIEYNLKTSLQRFKRDYTEATIKYLNTKANNPSWMVTGRDGRNARKDAKMNDRQTNQMFKLNEIIEKFNKSINIAKTQIRKEKSDLIKQEIKESLDTIKELPKFKRIKKEITTRFGSYNKMVYEYNNYSIFKDCATWSVYSPEGQQIYKSLTTGTLEECKKWLIYNINKVS